MNKVNVTEFIKDNDLRSFFPKINKDDLKKIDGSSGTARAYMHNSSNWFVHEEKEVEDLAFHFKYYGIAEVNDETNKEELNSLLATEIAREYVSFTYFGEELENLTRTDEGEWIYVY